MRVTICHGNQPGRTAMAYVRCGENFLYALSRPLPADGSNCAGRHARPSLRLAAPGAVRLWAAGHAPAEWDL
jgi:hypothetical protein